MDKKKDEIQVQTNLDSTPIYYTDNIHISVNEDGVVLDVMQKLLNSNQLRIVARIGMSKLHAEKLIKRFGELLLLTRGEGKSSNDRN
jgi:hypothetical protein